MSGQAGVQCRRGQHAWPEGPHGLEETQLGIPAPHDDMVGWAMLAPADDLRPRQDAESQEQGRDVARKASTVRPVGDPGDRASVGPLARPDGPVRRPEVAQQERDLVGTEPEGSRRKGIAAREKYIAQLR